MAATRRRGVYRWREAARHAHAHRVALLALLLALVSSAAVGSEPGSAEALRARYAEMADRLEHSVFGAPLLLESTEAGDELSSEVLARIDHPFERVRDALRRPRAWCDILLLHPNVTGCRTEDDAPRVTVLVGRAREPATFDYRVAAAGADYLDVRLAAAEGPVGTTHYRIRLEATPVDAKRTALRLVYAHGYGTRARILMRTYLGTLGRDKVGFTATGRDAAGHPVYIRGFRGAQERNAMRYYLCIEAYLDALAVPAERQFETRLARWYAQSERYSPQLHEEPEYLERKRKLAREPAA